MQVVFFNSRGQSRGVMQAARQAQVQHLRVVHVKGDPLDQLDMADKLDIASYVPALCDWQGCGLREEACMLCALPTGCAQLCVQLAACQLMQSRTVLVAGGARQTRSVEHQAGGMDLTVRLLPDVGLEAHADPGSDRSTEAMMCLGPGACGVF